MRHYYGFDGQTIFIFSELSDLNEWLENPYSAHWSPRYRISRDEYRKLSREYSLDRITYA